MPKPHQAVLTAKLYQIVTETKYTQRMRRRGGIKKPINNETGLEIWNNK